MTNAQTIEVSTRQIDYAQCGPAPRLARDPFLHLSHEVDNTFANALPFELPQENALFLSAQNEWQQAQKLSKAILAHPHPPDGASAAQEIKRLDDQLDNHTGRAVESINQIYYVAHREMKEAIATLQQAAKLASNNSSVLLSLAIAWVSQGNPTAALMTLKKAARIDAPYVKVHMYMGEVLRSQNDLHGALEVYRRALFVQPNSVEA